MLVGLSGYAQAGKDTVGNYLVQRYKFTRFAFADALKEMAYILNPIIIDALGADVRLQSLVDVHGWDNAKKDPEVRRLLQVLGTECGRDIIGPNVWINVLADKIDKNENEDIVITDCRFKNEAAYVKNKGELWWIEREGLTPLNDHPSENTLSANNAQAFIFNKADYTFMYEQVDLLMKRGMV